MSGSMEIVGKRYKRTSVSLKLTAVLPSWGILSKGRVTFYFQSLFAKFSAGIAERPIIRSFFSQPVDFLWRNRSVRHSSSFSSFPCYPQSGIVVEVWPAQ